MLNIRLKIYRKLRDIYLLCLTRISNKKMTKPVLYYKNLVTVLFLIISAGISPEFILAASVHSTVIQQDLTDKQLLLNGRIWQNLYSKAFNDQYFLTKAFLKGSVTLNGRKFENLDLKYDITNDELILSIQSYPIISMNKEMVDSFSLTFENRNYHIINAGTDTSSVLRGYVNVLYDGPTSLYVKYIKKIQPMAVDGRYDLFVQDHLLYLRKGSEILPVAGKRRLLYLLEDKKKEIRNYLKSTRSKLSGKDPDTFVPLLKYYDSLKE
jgi:hypothetical protein